MESQTDTDNQYFRTDDLLISSFLLCRQAVLVDVVTDSSRHSTFIFRDPDKCKRLTQEYVNGGTCIAKLLFSSREELLGLMRNRNGDKYGAYK